MHDELKTNRSLPWPVWLSGVGHYPLHQRVAGSIPGQDTCPGCRLHTYVEAAINVFL